jgi:hypothetical protein
VLYLLCAYRKTRVCVGRHVLRGAMCGTRLRSEDSVCISRHAWRSAYSLADIRAKLCSSPIGCLRFPAY